MFTCGFVHFKFCDITRLEDLLITRAARGSEVTVLLHTEERKLSDQMLQFKGERKDIPDFLSTHFFSPQQTAVRI